jgi:hypothetical protein
LQQFVQMMMGWVDGTAVLAAAELGRADHLAGGPRTVDELAPMGQFLRTNVPARSGRGAG